MMFRRHLFAEMIREPKEVVAGLLRETGVEPIDAGPLRNSRFP